MYRDVIYLRHDSWAATVRFGVIDNPRPYARLEDHLTTQTCTYVQAYTLGMYLHM